MLQSRTEVVLAKENMGLKPCQYILINNLVKPNQKDEDVVRPKDRLEKSAPNMQQVIHTDMQRMKTNKLYDRKLNQNLNGPKGLNWQCKHELQRLRSDERGIERDLIRLNHDLAKIASSRLINRCPVLSRTQISRLSAIAEENLPILTKEKPKLSLGRSSSINPTRTSLDHLIRIQKQSSMNKINPNNQQTHLLPKHSFQQIIAKTSDDRSYFQHHAYIINQQKRLVEQRIKKFLH